MKAVISLPGGRGYIVAEGDRAIRWLAKVIASAPKRMLREALEATEESIQYYVDCYEGPEATNWSTDQEIAEGLTRKGDLANGWSLLTLALKGK